MIYPAICDWNFQFETSKSIKNASVCYDTYKENTELVSMRPSFAFAKSEQHLP